jgi:hypothetical protein
MQNHGEHDQELVSSLVSEVIAELVSEFCITLSV